MKDQAHFFITIKLNEKIVEFPLSYESLGSLISSYIDDAAGNELFEAAATHPSSSVREQVAYKENLSEAAVEILKKDKSINVLRCLARTQAFRKYATFEDVERLISLDVEVAQSIASYHESFELIESSKIIEILLKSSDPSVLASLASNYSTPKKITKTLLNYPDPYVANEAKSRMKD